MNRRWSPQDDQTPAKKFITHLTTLLLPKGATTKRTHTKKPAELPPLSTRVPQQATHSSRLSPPYQPSQRPSIEPWTQEFLHTENIMWKTHIHHVPPPTPPRQFRTFSGETARRFHRRVKKTTGGDVCTTHPPLSTENRQQRPSYIYLYTRHVQKHTKRRREGTRVAFFCVFFFL